ncbi:hypothetical protein NPIL_122221 [Nephila pilipes]|uniref:Uncharacterized protein n=1 Tax=Nephila pilipes TaxID=299642 RepID=A0A8X6P0V7_NEPPI|nr:hypothetical protein NPIL_122221 [Nephila pilipes]
MAYSIESRPLNLKVLSLMDIYKYSDKYLKQAGNKSILTKLRKGLKLFQDKFVSSISFSEPELQGNDYFTVRAKASAEMETRAVYSLANIRSPIYYQLVNQVANFEALATQTLKQKNSSIQHILAVKYGLKTEDRVLSLVQHMYPKSIFRKSGPVIHSLDQYIVASPDRLIKSEVVGSHLANILLKDVALENTKIADLEPVFTCL